MKPASIFPVKSLARLALLLVCVACGKDSKPIIGIDPPVVLPPTLTAGSAQEFPGALNTVLDESPIVVVRDGYGTPLADVWVKWTASSGKIENDSSRTDANGRANAGRWTLGTVSGLQTVTARFGTVSVVAIKANVAPGPFVALVNVSPTITGVVGSDVATLPSVKAVDSFGNPVPGIFVFFSTYIGGGSITGAQQTTNSLGIATVGSWKLGTKTGTQAIRVDDSRTGANVVFQAIAQPATATQLVVIDGDAQTGRANQRLCTSPIISVRDQFGNGIGQVPIVFTPGAGSGTVTNGSAVSTAGTGYASVGAWTLSANPTQTLVVTSSSVPGVSLTLTATVTAGGAYSVCVRYVGDAGTPRQRQAVASAVQRWQRVIVGHVQTSPLTENANRCFQGAPAINETVEDLLVFVLISTIDGPGNVVARAGPCTVHMPSGLTQLGKLELDSADLEILLGQGTLDNMVAHEFGHVLGFGTLWTTRNLLSGSGTVDPIFTGASARAQFAQLFSAYAGPIVPVENTGDANTRDSHWRRSVFNNELMQGISLPVMPLSRVTVGSLGDIGYTVDLNNAEPFRFGATLQSSLQRSTHLVDDVATNEIWGVESNGRRSLIRSPLKPLSRN